MSGTTLLKRDIVAKLPRNLVATATLPATYEKARLAIEKCVQIDECKEWADKARALASYARQAKDDRMQKMATRIQVRAVRRCGELLKQIERSERGGRPRENGAADGPVSRRQAAKNAGLSPRQQKTATRVANVPQGDFDERVESDNPPTATALAQQGTRKQPKPLDRGDRTEERKEAAGESIDPEMILVARTDAVVLIEIVDFVIHFAIERENESSDEFDALAERVRIALGDQYHEPEPHPPDWRQALRQIRAKLDGMGEGAS